MVIGVPTEVKNNENRVALTPAGTKELVKRGHQVYIETSAGAGSGFSDDEYRGAGARTLDSAGELFGKADMIMKVKEPVQQEYSLIRNNQLVFTYFHFASNEQLRDRGKVRWKSAPVNPHVGGGWPDGHSGGREVP